MKLHIFLILPQLIIALLANAQQFYMRNSDISVYVEINQLASSNVLQLTLYNIGKNTLVIPNLETGHLSVDCHDNCFMIGLQSQFPMPLDYLLPVIILNPKDSLVLSTSLNPELPCTVYLDYAKACDLKRFNHLTAAEYSRYIKIETFFFPINEQIDLKIWRPFR